MLMLKPGFSKQLIPDMEYIKTNQWRLDSGDSFYNGYWVNDTVTEVVHIMPLSNNRFVAVTKYNVDRTYYYTVYTVRLYETGSNGSVTLLDSQNVTFPGLVNNPNGFKYTRTMADFKNVGDKLIVIAYVTTSWNSYQATAIKLVKHVYDFSGDVISALSTLDPYEPQEPEDTFRHMYPNYFYNIPALYEGENWALKNKRGTPPPNYDWFEVEFEGGRRMIADCRYVDFNASTFEFEHVFRFFRFGADGTTLESSKQTVPSQYTYSPDEVDTSSTIYWFTTVTQVGPSQAIVTFRRVEALNASGSSSQKHYDAFLVEYTTTPTVTLLESFTYIDPDAGINQDSYALDPQYITRGSKNFLDIREPSGMIPIPFYHYRIQNHAFAAIYNPNSQRAYALGGRGTRVFVEAAGDSVSLLKQSYKDFQGWYEGSEDHLEGSPDFVAHDGTKTYAGSFSTVISSFAGGESRLVLKEFDRIDFSALTSFGASQSEVDLSTRAIRYFNKHSEYEAVYSCGVQVGDRIIHLGSNKDRQNYTNSSWNQYFFSLYFLPPE